MGMDKPMLSHHDTESEGKLEVQERVHLGLCLLFVIFGTIHLGTNFSEFHISLWNICNNHWLHFHCR